MNTIKILGAIVAIHFLLMGGSCATTAIVDQSRNIVVDIPTTFYNCPQFKTIPDPDTLTNQQVADTIDTLIRYNGTCGINMKKIKIFMENAKKIEERNPA